MISNEKILTQEILVLSLVCYVHWNTDRSVTILKTLVTITRTLSSISLLVSLTMSLNPTHEIYTKMYII